MVDCTHTEKLRDHQLDRLFMQSHSQWEARQKSTQPICARQPIDDAACSRINPATINSWKTVALRCVCRTVSARVLCVLLILRSRDRSDRYYKYIRCTQ